MAKSLNGRTETVFEYAPDPHGAQLFGSLARWAGRSVNAARPIAERSATWYGPVATVQQFRGAAGMQIAARQSVYAQRAATINDQVTSSDSAVQDAFLARMRRGG